MTQLLPTTALTLDEFRWKTMKGEVLTLAQMETSHIFNSMKMVFNHLAAEWGAEPVWFQKHYSDYRKHSRNRPDRLAALVVFFIREIERRGDLPERYIAPYTEIFNQVAGCRGLPVPKLKGITGSSNHILLQP